MKGELILDNPKRRIAINRRGGMANVLSGMTRNLQIPRLLAMDALTDPRRNIEAECGYPIVITVPLYRAMYDRYALASRVVEVFPNESWSVFPELFENKRTKKTAFEKAWEALNVKHNLWSWMHRIDVLSGIGHYGVLLIGLNDGRDLSDPVEGIDPNTGERTGNVEHEITYLRTFDESLCLVQQWDNDPTSPRFGQPVSYTLKFVDPQTMAGVIAPVSAATLVSRRVHWTRVVHVADNRTTSEVWGVPRMMQVFNNLLDCRKILSGSAEMFWKGAFPGWAFETLPEFVEDAVLDEDSLRHQFYMFDNGLQRYIALQGMRAKSMAPNVSDPTNHLAAQLKIISAKTEVPLPVLFGSLAGDRESDQNVQSWHRRLSRRQMFYLTPLVIKPIINRFITYGALPPPESDDYFVEWADLSLLSDRDKAEVAMKKAQALFQYVTSGAEKVMPLLDFLIRILGFDLRTAEAIVASVKENKEDFTSEIWKQDKIPAMGGSQSNAKPSKSGSTGGRQPRNATSKKRGNKKRPALAKR